VIPTPERCALQDQYRATLVGRAAADLWRLTVIIAPISLIGEVHCSSILGLYHYRAADRLDARRRRG
jgi:hypothetical protein